MVHKQLELDYELGYYSDSSVPSAPGSRLAQTLKQTKYYEFNPVSNLRYCAGEHLITLDLVIMLVFYMEVLN